VHHQLRRPAARTLTTRRARSFGYSGAEIVEAACAWLPVAR
jgi:hypothetical protein